ncbi:ketopantoate reductase family protein [Leifsonia sp. NPDC058248]|uniref:ketopantoate reductase family protein n=1 Tax=Leifsonia sp. NPDC058248 TaxID=3346402 RepID=UPI0036DC3CFC
MTDARPVIAVVGPGAVGGLLAWLLHRAGESVVAVGRSSTVAAIRANGIEVRSGEFGTGVERVPASVELPRGASVIVATKTYGLADVLPRVAAAEPVEVLSLLNGIEHLAPLRAALPGVAVVGGSITVSALRASPTVIDHRSPFVRVEVPDAAAGFASVAALTAAGVSVRTGGTEAEVLWAKFRILASMALLTSYWREPVGVALSTDPELTEDVLAEVAACSTAEGVPATGAQLSAALRSVPAGMRTSLQEDLAADNPSELDAIGGSLVRVGSAHGVATPAIERIVEAIGGSSPR